MTRGGAVYIMASKRNGTLYTGVTADLMNQGYENPVNLITREAMLSKEIALRRKQYEYYRDGLLSFPKAGAH